MNTDTGYSDAHVSAYPVEYIAGIDLYNAGEFHAAHDAWEERWMGEVGPKEKLFLQAMIQSAVAFHHLDIGRLRAGGHATQPQVALRGTQPAAAARGRGRGTRRGEHEQPDATGRSLRHMGRRRGPR